jgi:hypothetical protein
LKNKRSQECDQSRNNNDQSPHISFLIARVLIFDN